MREVKIYVMESKDKNVAQQLKDNKKVLREIRKNRREQEVVKKILLILAAVIVGGLLVAVGMIVGRAWTFLQIMGC